MHLCFVDTETTGLFPACGDRICEIAIIVCDQDLKPLEKYESLIDPEREISSGAFQVNQITAEELADAPTFTIIATDIYDLLKGSYIVGHNVDFDIDFLKYEFSLIGKKLPTDWALDTKYIAQCMINLPSYGLSALIEEFNINVKHRHRAMGDCLATRDVFKRFLSEYLEDSETSFEGFIDKFGYKIDIFEYSYPEWLEKAYKDGTEVTINYMNRKGQYSIRRIRPVRFFESRGRQYIEAFCSLRESNRTFLLDRIRKADSD